MPSLLVHSITNLRIVDHTVTVYRVESKVQSKYDQSDLYTILDEYRMKGQFNFVDFLCALAACSRVMQIEVRDKNGDGFHTALIPNREIQEGGPKGPDGKQQPTIPLTFKKDGK